MADHKSNALQVNPSSPEVKNQPVPVSAQDAHNALIYKEGILDYDAHDAYLRAFGYEFMSLPCSCGGSEDDGHVPSCGWGKLERTERKHTPGQHKIIGHVEKCEIGNFYAIGVETYPGSTLPTAYVASMADAELYAAAPALLQQRDELLELIVALRACDSTNLPVREWAKKHGVDLGSATCGRVLDKAMDAAIRRATEGQ